MSLIKLCHHSFEFSGPVREELNGKEPTRIIGTAAAEDPTTNLASLKNGVENSGVGKLCN